MIRKKSLPPSSPGIGSKLNTPILIVHKRHHDSALRNPPDVVASAITLTVADWAGQIAQAETPCYKVNRLSHTSLAMEAVSRNDVFSTFQKVLFSPMIIKSKVMTV